MVTDRAEFASGGNVATMIKCPQCGAPCADDDRFCGECGASLAGVKHSPAPDSPAPTPPPAASQAAAEPEPAAPEPEHDARNGKSLSTGLIFALLIGAVLITGLLAKMAWDYANDNAIALVASENQSRSDARLGQAQEESSARRSEAGNEETDTGSTEEEPEDDLEAAAEAAAAEAERDVPTAQAPITAGQWELNWRINNVSGTQSLDPQTPRSSLPIGNSGRYARCVRSSEALSPRSIAFPLAAAANCQSDDYRMSGGRVSGEFTCRMPNNSVPVDAAINGDYTRDSVDVIMRMRMPASQIAKGPHANEMVEVFYQLSGSRTGGC